MSTVILHVHRTCLYILYLPSTIGLLWAPSLWQPRLLTCQLPGFRQTPTNQGHASPHSPPLGPARPGAAWPQAIHHPELSQHPKRNEMSIHSTCNLGPRLAPCIVLQLLRSSILVIKSYCQMSVKRSLRVRLHQMKQYM